ncbi:uncharacterized protein FOKN1_0618 [Thiohalobacter thiocyanaticus]|uniref:Hemerythrin-like domain-containing protein n=1 Tax=Thiohalobacter thiocyanaticus TaxID=585455 RepID=A0A1Z4VN16_9GAMM|nr:hemerythrin domain-containing protein [Thiohalobacter thiocyanaticus]BAZ93020.1 uncharacterized protein FOKN1_0618 [Thiohalobacter thiocyanaticus]
MPDFPFPQPAPGFDDPLGLLRACHMRMLMHCSTLEKLPAQIDAGKQAELQETVEKIRHYFNTAAHLHHQDEERDLFPLLEEQSPDFNAAVRELSAQHPELESAWRELDARLAELDRIDDSAALDARIRAFTNAYRQHIQHEEQKVLMPAEQALNDADRKRLGRAMARRRNVAEDALPDSLK